MRTERVERHTVIRHSWMIGLLLASGFALAEAPEWGAPQSGKTEDDLGGFLATECADPGTARARVGAFTDGLADLVIHLDGLPRSTLEIALDAVEQVAADSRGFEGRLCEVLESPAGRRVRLDELRQEFRRRFTISNGGVPGCIGLNSYQALVGLKTILDIAAEITQAFCDGTSCPEPFTPLSCFYSCFPTAPLLTLSATFQFRMDRADKCADLEHEIEMAGLRESTSQLVLKASNSASAASTLASSTFTNSATEAALSGASAALAEAFDGGTRASGAPEAIGPGLDGLNAAVAAQQAEQADFERKALQARLEAAMASGVVYSRMQRPRQYGGLLDQVRELVALRIQSTQAAGGDTTAALDAFRAGDAAFNAGDYRGALGGYRAAYVALGESPSTGTSKGE